MHCKISNLTKLIMLFFSGGCMYTMVEIMFKGDSHWTMFILGGICFLLVGGINSIAHDMPLSVQMGVSAVIITVLEFITGCIVNLWLNFNVWDYTALPFNLFGQICPLFTFLWYWLSAVGIFAEDFMRTRMFCEPKREYRII